MIAKAPFGSTGHESSRTLFGAAAFGHVSPADAERTFETLLRHGVNHIDTAASYGASEDVIGPWMEHHRDQFFLATKTHVRDKQSAYDMIQKSLERLRVDHVDLIQLHNLVDPNEWEQALGPDGALEACVQARDEGLTRFIGVTGHGLTVAEMHRKALERFPFDSVLLPLNYPLMQNEAYRRDFLALYELCRERGVAMQTIKSITRGPWGDKEQTRATWYEPLEEPRAIDLAVAYVFGHDGVFLNTAGDVDVLPKVLASAERYDGPPTAAQLAQLERDFDLEPLFTT